MLIDQLMSNMADNVKVTRQDGRWVDSDIERSLQAERDDYWQALTDIVGFENWQAQGGRPHWRQIADEALAKHEDTGDIESANIRSSEEGQ